MDTVQRVNMHVCMHLKCNSLIAYLSKECFQSKLQRRLKHLCISKFFHESYRFQDDYFTFSNLSDSAEWLLIQDAFQKFCTLQSYFKTRYLFLFCNVHLFLALSFFVVTYTFLHLSHRYWFLECVVLLQWLAPVCCIKPISTFVSSCVAHVYICSTVGALALSITLLLSCAVFIMIFTFECLTVTFLWLRRG